MTKQQTPPMDWEATMKATEAHAQVSAKMTQRAVAALAETLDLLRHHGQRLARMEAMMKEAQARLATPPPQPRPSSPQTRAPRRFRPLPILAAFLAGAVFAGFIAIW